MSRVLADFYRDLLVFAVVAYGGYSLYNGIYGEPVYGDDDWTVFDRLAAMDRAGNTLDCESLLKTTMTKTSSNRFSPNKYVVDIMDYRYESEYAFRSCNDQLTQLTREYCDSHFDESIQDTMFRVEEQTTRHGSFSRWLPYKTRFFCGDEIETRLSSIATNYTAPTGNIKFITQDDEGIAIDPSEVEDIRFGLAIRPNLWGVMVKTGDWRYHGFYFGDEGSYRNAKAEIIEAISDARTVQLAIDMSGEVMQ